MRSRVSLEVNYYCFCCCCCYFCWNPVQIQNVVAYTSFTILSPTNAGLVLAGGGKGDRTTTEIPTTTTTTTTTTLPIVIVTTSWDMFGLWGDMNHVAENDLIDNLQINVSTSQTTGGKSMPMNWDAKELDWTHLTSLLNKKKWYTQIELSYPSRDSQSMEYTISVQGTRKIAWWSFGVYTEQRSFTVVSHLAQAIQPVVDEFLVKRPVTRLNWLWQEGIFLYGLGQYEIAMETSTTADRTTVTKPEISNLITLKAYHQYHSTRGIGSVTWSDECSPGLSALQLLQHWDNPVGEINLQKVVDYIATEPRTDIGALDHLGFNHIAHWVGFPLSIWIDSLMMYAILAVRYGVYNHDESLLRFGLEQPIVFWSKLRHNATGLLHHAYNLKSNQLYPRNNALWLRGNGWAVASVVDMLEVIGPQHNMYEALATLFVELIDALMPFQQVTGYWLTVITDDAAISYEESSGTALVAYAMAKGSRLSLLSKQYRVVGRNSLRAIISRLQKRSNGYSMEEISIGTNPSSRWGYNIIPVARNLPYGVGALLLLAGELYNDEF